MRAPLRGSLYEASVQREVAEEDVQKAFALRPELGARVRVALYARDPSVATRLATDLAAAPMVESTYVIAPFLVSAENRGSAAHEDGRAAAEPGGGRVSDPISVRTLRLLAARARADVLVLVDQGARVERDANGLAAFGAVLVPLLFLPFQDVAVDSWLDLYLVDTASGYLYGAASADHHDADAFLTLYSRRGEELAGGAFEGLVRAAVTRLGELMVRERARTAPPLGPQHRAFALREDTTDPWRLAPIVVALGADGQATVGGATMASREELLVRVAGLIAAAGPSASAVLYADPDLPTARLLAVADDLERLGVRHVRFVSGAPPAAVAPATIPPAPAPKPYGPSELADPFGVPR